MSGRPEARGGTNWGTLVYETVRQTARRTSRLCARTLEHGTVTAVQPRFRLGRSLDQRHHEYLGYALRVRGEIDGRSGTAWFGVGKAAHERHRFQVGQELAGRAERAAEPRLEVVDYYKVSRIAVKQGAPPTAAPPPWHGVAPPIEVYRERGHRRLAARTYTAAPCSSCIWGAHMAVELIVDHWNPEAASGSAKAGATRPAPCFSPSTTRSPKASTRGT